MKKITTQNVFAPELNEVDADIQDIQLDDLEDVKAGIGSGLSAYALPLDERKRYWQGRLIKL